MTTWQEQSVTRDGVRLSFVRTGSGDKQPLLLCHGLTDNGLCWSRVAAALEAEFDVVMIDARNHGLSGNGPASVHDLAADACYILNHLGFDRTNVVGHSVGAVIAAAFAGDFPEKTNKIILEDPPWKEEIPAPDPEKAAEKHAGFATYIKMMQDKTDDAIRALGHKQHPTWHDDDFPAWALSKKQVRADATERLDLSDWSKLVPKIASPTLLLHGDQDNGCDGIVTVAMAKKAAALNTNISTKNIAGAGHNMRREKFEPFIATVKTFLNDV